MNFISGVNRILYLVCIICLILAVVLSLALIWGGGDYDYEIVYKSLLSAVVIFVAALLAAVVNNVMIKKREG